MTTKIFAVILLSLALTACEPATTDNNPNSNNPSKTNSNNQASPAPPVTSTPQPSPTVKAELKAGDKVKVAVNGSAVDATVVAVDEKAGKATVRLQGDSKDTIVSLDKVTTQ